MNNPFENIEQRLDKLEQMITNIGTTISTPPPAVEDSGILVKIEKAMKITGYKRGYLYELVHRNAIPFIKRGRSVRFDPAELEAWMRANRPDVLRETIERLR